MFLFHISYLLMHLSLGVIVYNKVWPFYLVSVHTLALIFILNPCYKICVVFSVAQLGILPIVYTYYFFYFAVVCILRTIWWLFLFGHNWIWSLTRSAACMVHIHWLLSNFWPIGAWVMHISQMWQIVCGNQGWKACSVIWLEQLILPHLLGSLPHPRKNIFGVVGFILGYVLHHA